MSIDKLLAKLGKAFLDKKVKEGSLFGDAFKLRRSKKDTTCWSCGGTGIFAKTGKKCRKCNGTGKYI